MSLGRSAFSIHLKHSHHAQSVPTPSLLLETLQEMNILLVAIGHWMSLVIMPSWFSANFAPSPTQAKREFLLVGVCVRLRSPMASSSHGSQDSLLKLCTKAAGPRMGSRPLADRFGSDDRRLGGVRVFRSSGEVQVFLHFRVSSWWFAFHVFQLRSFPP